MSPPYQPDMFGHTEQHKKKPNSTANRVDSADRRFHDWYRFVLSFPPHLVREYLARFGADEGQVVLDPFCGTGTTLVEAKLRGLASIGVEANPVSHLASSTKVSWDIDGKQLLRASREIVELCKDDDLPTRSILRTLPPEQDALLLRNSISPVPLHRALLLWERIKSHGKRRYFDHERVAFAKAVVLTASNLHFGPEVGVRRIKLVDAPVAESWFGQIRTMTEDIASAPIGTPRAKVFLADARDLGALLKPKSVDHVFTSPPYPNEKDYSRTTRLESVLLGFIKDKAELRAMKENLLRSNTRNAYNRDTDDSWISDHSQIQGIAQQIEERRVQLGKTSGFERLYARVTLLYFGGMARHLANLRPFLRPGAHLGYVVGDQASYLQVHIPTGTLLADLAERLGYRVDSIDLFRSRFATATKRWMREEVVVLRWPGL